MSLLETDEIFELTTILVRARASREMLLGFLDPQLAGQAPNSTNSPRDAFVQALQWLAGLPRTKDGSLPLQVFLNPAAQMARDTHPQDAARLQAMADEVAQRSDQARAAPPANLLPEASEAVFGQDDRLGLEFFRRALETARRVVKLTVPVYTGGVEQMDDAGEPLQAHGTGWVFGKGGLIITNAHVIRARASKTALVSVADLDAQLGGTEVLFDFAAGKQPVAAGIESLEVMDRELDFAILKLATPFPDREPLPLQLRSIVLGVGAQAGTKSYKPVNIVQHPGGAEKVIAFRNNLVTRSEAQTLRYFTDTEAGSSGSPVCNDLWHVVALHRSHGALGKVQNFQGRLVASANIGTQMAAIHQKLVNTQRWAEFKNLVEIAP